MRLITGEDIIAQIDEHKDKTVIINPMNIMFKRMQTGKAMILMTPWIPVEIVADNMSELDNENILSVMNPRQTLIDHYIDVVEKMAEIIIDEKDLEMSSSHEGEEEDDDSLYDMEDLEDVEDLDTKKKLH